MKNRIARKVAVIVAVGVALLGTAGPAQAAPENVWRTGYFTFTGAAVYAEQTHDRPQQRPLWTAHDGEPVRIECYDDYFFLVRSPRGDGWTFRDISVKLPPGSKRVWQCSWFDRP